MFVFRKSYFNEIWDKIDFLLVMISVIDLVTPLLNTDDERLVFPIIQIGPGILGKALGNPKIS